MKYHFKQLLSYFMIGVLFSSILFWVPEKQASADETKSGCLILVEKNKGHWVAYTDLGLLTADKHVMIKAKSFAAVTGLKYSNDNKKKQFIMKGSKKNNRYKVNSKVYQYISGSHKSKKPASCKAYYDKDNKENLCQAETLASLCNYKSFSAKKYKYYNSNFAHRF